MSKPTHLTDVRLDSLDLHPNLIAGVQDVGLEYCTPIQAETLPLALAGKNVAGQAQTGTGKTAAFLLATINRLLNQEPPKGRRANQPRALIVAPTRELAQQIAADAKPLCEKVGLTFCVVYGGTAYKSQQQAVIDGVDILIGTPGRLIDYHKQHNYDLKVLEVAVLDEADRMFDLGFIKDIRYLFNRMPAPDKRLNLLFSATLSHKVMELAYEHLGEPKWIRTETDSVTAERVRQQLFHVESRDKIWLLLHILKTHDPERTMLFVNTRREADEVTDKLERAGYKVGALSGDVPQNKRESLLQDFRENKLPILVATDVAARGLHVPAVSHVINYDLPQDAEDYVHRIGRTARAGADGDAISFCCERYVYSLPDIEEYLGQKFSVEHPDQEWLTPWDLPPSTRKKRPPNPRGGGRRPGGGGGGNRGGGGRRR
ncbi:MAG: DEAD/DEAH box helicase [Oceanococcus sp.]